MQQRKLGRSDITVSVLGLGTWAMQGSVESWGPVDDNESIAAIHAALDAGINLFDTAPIYGGGHSEIILGRALAGCRDRAIIATKCGLLVDAQQADAPQRCLSEQSIFAECEASLRRLKTEYIDLYQCHWPDPQTSAKETFTALEKLKQQGKIRAIGLSNYGCELALHAREYATIASMQPPFSLLDRRAADDVIPFCREHDIAVLAYSPLAKGMLAGQLRRDSDLVGVRRKDPEFVGARYVRNLEFVDRLRELAASRSCTPAQIALAWVIQFDGVTSAIMGAKRPSQVLENVKAASVQLSTDDIGEIENLRAMLEE